MLKLIVDNSNTMIKQYNSNINKYNILLSTKKNCTYTLNTNKNKILNNVLLKNNIVYSSFNNNKIKSKLLFINNLPKYKKIYISKNADKYTFK